MAHVLPDGGGITVGSVRYRTSDVEATDILSMALLTGSMIGTFTGANVAALIAKLPKKIKIFITSLGLTTSFGNQVLSGLRSKTASQYIVRFKSKEVFRKGTAWDTDQYVTGYYWDHAGTTFTIVKK